MTVIKYIDVISEICKLRERIKSLKEPTPKYHLKSSPTSSTSIQNECKTKERGKLRHHRKYFLTPFENS